MEKKIDINNFNLSISESELLSIMVRCALYIYEKSSLTKHFMNLIPVGIDFA